MRFGLRLLLGREMEENGSDGRFNGECLTVAMRAFESRAPSEYTEKAFASLSPCLLGGFDAWIVLLCKEVASGLNGCRCMDVPLNVGIARAQPLKTGSFSVSRTSIFFVRFAKFNELSVS